MTLLNDGCLRSAHFHTRIPYRVFVLLLPYRVRVAQIPRFLRSAVPAESQILGALEQRACDLYRDGIAMFCVAL